MPAHQIEAVFYDTHCRQFYFLEQIRAEALLIQLARGSVAEKRFSMSEYKAIALSGMGEVVSQSVM